MSLADVLEYLDKHHRTTLSRYRGKPWREQRLEEGEFPPELAVSFDGDPVQSQGWQIFDKVTGSHLAYAYQHVLDRGADGGLLRVVYAVPTDSSEEELTGPHDSLAACGDEVWRHSVSKLDRRTWWTFSYLVRMADAVSALAKLLLKASLAILSILAVGAVIVRVASGQSMLGSVIGLLFDLPPN